MASPALRKLLRNHTTASRIPTFLRQTYDALIQIPQPNQTTTFSNPPETKCLEPNHSFGPVVYPSFPFGYFLGPLSQTPSRNPEMDEEMAPDNSNIIIRADSVKKKRKKKMNKHKLRKLRKRLRKKS
ncbi:Unknown protein [Striga hermonthica]|uniref:Small ribosomal subunit protein mS38 n=1 Tax=Striga hermonthica TaxID=68872 RepID=A0A9N7RKX5_STRHE|nr:Unknown protein [Striga hermonthica]